MSSENRLSFQSAGAVPRYVAEAMARRQAAGFTLTFQVPGRSDPFTCYAKDEPQKQYWLDSAARKGWTLVAPLCGND